LPPIPGASNTGTRLSVSAGDDAAGRDYENPFKLPSDDKIFRVRDEEKRKRQEERDAGSKIKLWDKTKGDVTSRTERLQKLVGDMKLSADDLGKLDETKGAIAMHHRQEKGKYDGIHCQETRDVFGANEFGHEARRDPKVGREGPDERRGSSAI
jgi:hypothetical protein